MALDRNKVTRAALDLLNQVGLDGLTVRKLGDALGVQAAALYWHFKNKQEMLDQMATLALADASHEFGPPRANEPWQDWCLRYGRSLRQTLLRYRDGARMISGIRMTDPALFVAMESSLQVFQDQGFQLPEAAQALHTLYCYVIGFTIEEQAVPLPSGEEQAQPGLDERFEAGLHIVIGGIRLHRFGESAQPV